MTRLVPKQEPHRRCAIGERGRDGLQSNLRDLVDGKRQHMRRQPVTEPRQCTDQRRAMRLVMHQHHSLFAAGLAAGHEHRAHLPHQRVCRRQCIGRRPGRAGGRALAAASANVRVDRDGIAGRCYRASRT